MGTVILKMKEEDFWKCTPRKLFALADVHKKANSPDEAKKQQEVEQMTLEDLMAIK